MEKLNISIGMLRSSGLPATRAKAMSLIGKQYGVEIYFFNINDVNTSTKKIKAKKLINDIWCDEIIDYPLVIDNDNNFSLKNKENFNDLDKHCYLTTQLLGGKLKTLNILKDNNIFSKYLIPQEIIRNKSDFLSFVYNNKKSVLKPIKGSQGSNIYFIDSSTENIKINFEGKINNDVDLDSFYNEIIRGKNFIIQKYISSKTVNNAPFDIRIHVQRDGNNNWFNTKTYVRVGTNSGLTANIATGGGIANFRPFIISRYDKKSEDVFSKIKDITKNLPEMFQKFYSKDIDALGIDLGVDDDGNPWIFEINSFPGTKFFELEEANIRIKYLKYLYHRINSTKNINYSDLSKISSNLVIDNQLSSSKNIAILKSKENIVGVSKDFIKRNINKIDVIIHEPNSAIEDLPTNKCISLNNIEDELFKISNKKRRKLQPLVYSIIGSMGKTSVMSILIRSLKKVQKKSYVNDFGNTPFYISKGVLSAPLDSTHWIFEVAGASTYKEKPISIHSHNMIEPDVCIFTNIAEAHVGNIGSLKNIAELKSSALQVLPKNSIVIFNLDMPYQEVILNNINSHCRKYSYGISDNADFKLINNNKDEICFEHMGEIHIIQAPTGLSTEIKLNFLAVIASLYLTEEKWKIACEYFKDWKPVKGRGNIQLHKINDQNLTVINDSYNANPDSMKLAIENLINYKHSDRKIAVLGSLAELGQHDSRIHKDLIDFVINKGLDKIIFIGESFCKFQSENDNVKFYSDITKFKEEFDQLIRNNDLILFKGSNSSKLYNFLNNL